MIPFPQGWLIIVVFRSLLNFEVQKSMQYLKLSLVEIGVLVRWFVWAKSRLCWKLAPPFATNLNGSQTWDPN